MARLSLVGFEGLGQVTLRLKHAAYPFIGHRQIALPSGIAGIGLGETVSDREAVAVVFERLGQIALRLEHAAYLVIGHRQIALPSGIAGIGLGEAVC